jgi:DNA mismatch repair protein MutH
VRLDLQACATEAGAVAGARSGELADAVDWVNEKVLRRERGREGDALASAFSRCLTKRAYATRPVSRVASE